MKKPIEIRAKWIAIPLIILIILGYIYSGFYGVHGLISDDGTKEQGTAFGIFLAITLVALLIGGISFIGWIGKKITKYIKIVD